MPSIAGRHLLPRIFRTAKTRAAEGCAGEYPDALWHFNRGVLMAEEGLIFAAVEAYGRAMESGDAHLAARSAFNIATLSVRAGDVGRAAANYSTAIGYGDPDVTPKAEFNLARLLEAQGDLLGAGH